MSDEMFTLQIQGKGIRLKARVPGWVAATVFIFAKPYEQAAPKQDGEEQEAAKGTVRT